MTLYALALKDPAGAVPTGFLSSVAGLEGEAALAFARANPGFLGRALQPAAAEKLIEAASAMGLDAALFAEEDLPSPPAPLKPAKIELSTSGFFAHVQEKKLFVKSEDISILAAWAWDARLPPASAAEAKADVFMELARLAGMQDAAAAAPPRRETFFRADIMAAADGAPLRLLLEPENMDFSTLGPKREPSSLLNFRLLLDGLAAPAFGAAKNAALLAFLAGRPLAPLKTAGPEACDAGLSRLLLLANKKAGR